MEYNETFLKDLQIISPDTFVIGRLYDARQDLGQTVSDSVRLGREFAERILREPICDVEVNGEPVINAWQSYNERCHTISSPQEHRQYDAFMASFRDKMISEGFEAIGLNSATGNLTPEQLIDYYPAMLSTYTYLGFHEYDYPTMWRLHKESQSVDGGMWLTLRYRRLMEPVIKQYGLGKHQVYITECGMTAGVCGGADVGWRTTNPAMVGTCKIPKFPIPVESYWESLKWYHEELLKDSYVAGALLFACGATSQWSTFESTELMYKFHELIGTKT